MTRRAEKLFEQMTASLAGWGIEDLHRLYEGFGFNIKHGAKHDVVKHPQWPEFRATLPRSNSLAKAYVRFALQAIESLKSRIDKEAQ